MNAVIALLKKRLEDAVNQSPQLELQLNRNVSNIEELEKAIEILVRRGDPAPRGAIDDPPNLEE